LYDCGLFLLAELSSDSISTAAVIVPSPPSSSPPTPVPKPPVGVMTSSKVPLAPV